MESILGGAYNIYDGDHYGDVIWARNAGITEINHRWYENTGMKNDYNLYTRFNFIFAENIRTFTDFQVRGINYRIIGIDDDLIDISQKHNFLFFNPKIGLNYDLSGNDQLYLSFSVANREPNRSNFKDSKKGDPVPRHETLYDYEAGYKHRRQNWLFDVNFYYMDYNNQLVLTGEINNVGDPVMKNVKDSYRTGCEIISSFNISRNLRWDFNLTLSRNKIKNMNIYVDNWDYWNDPDNEPLQYSFPKRSSNISFSPPVIAGNIFAIKASQDLSVEIHSKYVGKQYIDNSESVERMLDPYFVNDLMLFYSRKLKYVKQLDVSLSLINIFNQKYISNAWVYSYFEDKEENRLDGYFPQAGIHFLAGLTLKF
jgi:iron complex outermembrane receptor protein